MNIVNIKGDITDVSNYDLKRITILCHQTNVHGVYGAGCALSIKNKFPIAYKEYNYYCDDNSGINILGNCQITNTEYPTIFVANLFGQSDFGTYQRQTNYEAIYVALEKLKMRVKNEEVTLAFPIGMSSGLGGGNWNIIYTMIVETFKDSNCTLIFVEYQKLKEKY